MKKKNKKLLFVWTYIIFTVLVLPFFIAYVYNFDTDVYRAITVQSIASLIWLVILENIHID